MAMRMLLFSTHSLQGGKTLKTVMMETQRLMMKNSFKYRERNRNPLWSSAHTVLTAVQEGCAWYCVSFEQVINCH